MSFALNPVYLLHKVDKMATAKPAPNKSSTQTEGRDARATNWSETETKVLIAVWTDEGTQTATEDPFTRNKKIFKQISETLTRMGYNCTAKQVKNKIQSLKQKYKSVVYANNTSLVLETASDILLLLLFHSSKPKIYTTN